MQRGKGGKFRVVPMGAKVERALDRYLSHKGRPAGTAVFLTLTGEPMTYAALHQVFRQLEAKTGIACNPHMWRHSAAIAYLRGGGRVEVLRTLLGHTTLDMSLHYARTAGVDLTAAHETADPARAEGADIALRSVQATTASVQLATATKPSDEDEADRPTYPPRIAVRAGKGGG